MADLQSLVHNVPPVTRFLLVSIILVTGPVLLGQLSTRTVYLSWHDIRHGWELWRVPTSFLFVGSGFSALYDCFLTYRNSSSLETTTYMNQTGDYAWANLMIGAIILLINTAVGMPFLFRPLLHAQNYLWCRSNATMTVNLFGLLSLPVPYYPIALIVLELILGGVPKAIGGVVGMLAGHTWWFLSTYLPGHPSTKLRRRNPVAAPAMFLRLFEQPRRANIQGRGFEATRGSGPRAGPSASSATSTGHNWGRSGQKLGGDPL